MTVTHWQAQAPSLTRTRRLLHTHRDTASASGTRAVPVTGRRHDSGSENSQAVTATASARLPVPVALPLAVESQRSGSHGAGASPGLPVSEFKFSRRNGSKMLLHAGHPSLALSLPVPVTVVSLQNIMHSDALAMAFLFFVLLR